MQPQSIALLQKIDTNIEQILLKFGDIFNIALNDNKTREQLAVESLTLESDALTIIRLCQDLLYVSRTIKEVWCLNSMKVGNEKDSKRDIDHIFDKFNKLTELTSKFESKNPLA